MELFDRKYLHCMWSEEIDGKECLLCDNLSDLIKDVNNGNNLDVDIGHVIVRRQIKRSDGVRIADVNDISWIYAYYDPNYECKVAYSEGKQIEYKEDFGIWCCATSPEWRDGVEYRIKSEEPKRMTYRQLAEWLSKGNGQSRYKKGSPTIGFMYDYEHENKQLTEDFKIRSWGLDEWIEPTADVYLKDCKQENINAD